MPAPFRMNWQQLLSPSRLGSRRSSREEPGRSPFHKDHDRIIFSGSFRRLGRKTQVHPLVNNDHIHTRLTHSLEVACVGRSLGMLAGENLKDRLPGWITAADLGVIVQAACLAHDIGNPPFGHAGEYAIRDWFQQAETRGLLQGLSGNERQDLLTFEGNAQGFRVVTQIEYNQFSGGMRLTHATLGAMLKYPWTVEHAGPKGKFSAFQTEKHQLQQTAEHLGLIQTADWCWARHPLVYLVEAADDICYALLDLEDGLEMEILGYQEVAEILESIGGGQPQDFSQLAKASRRRRIAALRGQAMEKMVEAVIAAFVQYQDELLEGRFAQDLIDVCPPAIAQGIRQAKILARDRIFHNQRKAKLEIGAYTTLGTLLETFCEACNARHHQPGALSFKHQRVLALIGENMPEEDWPLYQSYRRALDFIGGMTDNYAVDVAQEMSGQISNLRNS
ncbi:deoxyguanosinetriphosphate triphosphohydrolase [Marinospirillum sp.]|uniref:deoxyguanosinetriphosphate triphosphohydrolase n=1 Tax=Marinospirillum sp. TaxID=2183934 RepID=UPI0028704442|nr:deoxyguanosinetriphosphate triphosphohydrolase [Marinospirillum sp.]MDR9468063.1 deoxyguanosinetriphosphate triphosphohydrolase [Marinospirillum sp.]